MPATSASALPEPYHEADHCLDSPSFCALEMRPTRMAIDLERGIRLLATALIGAA
jgi:hypothetical protein